MIRILMGTKCCGISNVRPEATCISMLFISYHMDSELPVFLSLHLPSLEIILAHVFAYMSAFIKIVIDCSWPAEIIGFCFILKLWMA